MEDTILKRTEGKYTIHVFKQVDDSPDLSWLTDGSRYSGCLPEEIADYKRQDEERLSAYHAGEWYMVGVVCEISVKTKTNWAIDPVIARSSVWGIESDSGDYFNEVAEEQIAEAKADLNNLKAAICG